ncbi:MAG: ribbon-helix-helix domain-containing protein [Spirochaetales bacterium]|nr:ribbon-helix-helix domain-containing protein [Spirochaetales bacterium]
MKETKQEVISFKVDEELGRVIKNIPNRSEFIRKALLNALDNTCPLCRGTGIITPQQKKHWDAFTENHDVEVCEDCHAVHLVCRQGEKKDS